MTFRDHFSSLAQGYARFRPSYPPELFDWLAAQAPGRGLAWDCGTGNGQAALGLARHFARVAASDASAEQIAQAAPHPGVEYRVEPAEQSSLAAGSCDLVTVAQAVHWFNLDAFYAEARRVLKPGGLLAVWTYHLFRGAPAVDAIVERYYSDILGGFWPEAFHHVRERYATLPFPFEPVQAPLFELPVEWDFSQMAGFLASWSAGKLYEQAHGQNPLALIWDDLRAAWGAPEQRRLLKAPIYVRAGRA